MITLAVRLNDLTHEGYPGIVWVFGMVDWDDSLLELDGVDAGDAMRQGGVAPQCCLDRVFGWTQPFRTLSGRVVYPFEVTRPWDRNTNAPPAVPGSGEVFLFRLKPRAGVTVGASTVGFVPWGGDEFDENAESFRLVVNQAPARLTPRLNASYYGGTITVR